MKVLTTLWVTSWIIGLILVGVIIYLYVSTEHNVIKWFGRDLCKNRDGITDLLLPCSLSVRKEKPKDVFTNPLIHYARILISESTHIIALFSKMQSYKGDGEDYSLAMYYPYLGYTTMPNKPYSHPTNDGGNRALLLESMRSSSDQKFRKVRTFDDIHIPTALEEEITKHGVRVYDALTKDVEFDEDGFMIDGIVAFNIPVKVFPYGINEEEACRMECTRAPYIAIIPKQITDGFNAYIATVPEEGTILSYTDPDYMNFTKIDRKWITSVLSVMSEEDRHRFYTTVESKNPKYYYIKPFRLEIRF